jgi:RNA polymerase sigma-70 factor, ECF subfamily
MEPAADPPQREREESFRRLFERYWRPLSVFFLHRGFSREESRDLTQETFLSVYRGMESFREESRIETWLFKIATHVSLNAVRYRRADKRDKQEISLEEAWEQGLPVFGRCEPVHGVGPSEPRSQLEEMLAQERTQRLKAAMSELPPRMRRCVFLRVEQGLKYREIALVTGVSIQTVKAQLHQARKQLRAKLGGYFAEVDLDALEGEDDE